LLYPALLSHPGSFCGFRYEIESEDKMVAKTTETVETSTEMTQPVIIDLGGQKSKYLKELKEGQGKLWDEVLDVIEEVKDMLGKEADGKVLVPVIMLYERTGSQRLSLDKILFPLLDDDDEEE
jgi:hypothetical protein